MCWCCTECNSFNSHCTTDRNVKEIQVTLDGNNFQWHETNIVFLANMGTLSAIKNRSVELPNEGPCILRIKFIKTFV